MTSVYSVIATTIGLSLVKPSHGASSDEQGERRDGVDHVRHREQRPGTSRGRRTARYDSGSDEDGAERDGDHRVAQVLQRVVPDDVPVAGELAAAPDRCVGERAVTRVGTSPARIVHVDGGVGLGLAGVEARVDPVAGGDAVVEHDVAAADEVATNSVAGCGEQLGGRVELGDVARRLASRRCGAEEDRLVDVVGDEHDGLVQLALQRGELALQLGAHDRVDGAERLVHQQHRRVGGERAGDADALLLAARQLRRVLRRPASASRPTSSSSSARPGVARGACPSRAGAAPSSRCRAPCGAGTGRSAG